jgi:tetratricopeptide (TPR) repeat protein
MKVFLLLVALALIILWLRKRAHMGSRGANGPKSRSIQSAQEHFEQALNHIKKGDLDRALISLNRVIELDPMAAEAFCCRGGIHVERGDFDSAIVECGKAIQLDPNFDDAYSTRGQAYARKGVFDCALQDYDAALRINPMNLYLHYEKGLAYESMDRTEDAIAAFKEYVRCTASSNSSLIEEAKRRIKKLQGQ